MRLLVAVLLLALGVDAAPDDTALLERGRQLTKTYLAGDTSAIWAQMEPTMQRVMRSEEALAKFRRDGFAELGHETEVLSETVRRDAGFAIYERTARWSKVEAPYVIRWEIGANDKVVGFGISEPQKPREPSPTQYLDYQTMAPLRLPFDGEWFVYWGGRTVEQNIHIVQAQQRFAYDFAISRDGSTHRGEGSSVEDYYCWGSPIRSPAAATVVDVVGDLPDQQIGAMDKVHLAGNRLILDLGNGEYAVLAHMRQGSVRVKAGDKVGPGDELGRCGNSGNTSEPHLHFHLQNSPRFAEGEGLPAFFVDYVADGKPVARGEPTKGQTIRTR